MKAKKIIVLLTTICMLCGLVACGDEADTKVDDGEVTVNENGSSGTSDEKKEIGTYDEITEEVVRNHAVTDAGYFEYGTDTESDGNGIKIYGYTGTDVVVVIPEEIDGRPVTAVGMAFANDSTVRGVLFPASVKRLGSSFANNENIEVVICEGVEVIGDVTFGNCKSLRTLLLGDSLKELSKSIFFVPSLQELYLPPTLETIGEGALCWEDFTIKGKSGSFIESYCNEHEIDFEAVD